MFKKWATYLKFVYQISSAKLNCLGIPLTNPPMVPTTMDNPNVRVPGSFMWSLSSCHSACLGRPPTYTPRPSDSTCGPPGPAAIIMAWTVDGGRSSHCWATRLGCLSPARRSWGSLDKWRYACCLNVDTYRHMISYKKRLNRIAGIA